MAWTDKPTDNQIGTLLYLMQWELRQDEIPRVVKFLESNCTRKDVSNELGRLRDLMIERKMNRDTAFAGEIWKNYKY